MHKSVEHAVDQTWNCHFVEAEAYLSTFKATNPRFALEYAMSFMVKSLMNSTNEKREGLLALFQAADGLASSTRKHPPEPHSEPYYPNNVAEYWKLECDIIYADALLVRSLTQLTMNYYVKGCINLRKTWGHYYSLLQLVEKDPNIPIELQLAIKCGCGIFYTYLALVPAGLMKVLSAIGFISDRELGEQYLTEVFQSNSIRAPLAALVLCTYYLFLPTGLGKVEVTLAKAKIILEEMNRRFPTNTCFFGYANFFHRKRGEPKEALQCIAVATSNAEKFGLLPLLLRYLHADTLYMDLQFEAAKIKYLEVLDTLTKSGETFAYTGQVVLSLAACYVMTGDDKTALEWLAKVNKMYNPNSKQDANSPKFAAKVLAEHRLLPLLGVYILYINRDLAHMRAEHVEVLRENLNRIVVGKDISSPEVAGMFRLFLAVMAKSVHDKATAKRELEDLISPDKRFAADSMVPAYAYYELGELEYHSGHKERAKQLLEKGASLKGDGHETLANRYRIALKQIHRDLKSESKTA